MISMWVKDHLGEAVRNRTSLIFYAGLVYSIVVRLASCSKGRPTLHLSNGSPFGGTLTTLPSWSVAMSSPLWHYKAPSLRRLRTNQVERLARLSQEV